jgi:hypothetical protein
MDQGSLVTEQIDAGSRLIDEFDKYAKIRVAFWVKESETGHWYLYLVSDKINDTNFDLAYGEVFRIVGKERQEWLDPFEVKVAGVDDAVAQAVMKIQQESPTQSAVRLRNLKLADLAVDELYLYSPLHNHKATKKPRKTGKR